MKWLCTLILFAAMQVVTAQRVEYKTFAEVDSFFETSNDTLYVVNFWATWCKPCIEELPSFEKINAEYKNQKVKVILISLDAQIRWESGLIPFLQANNYSSSVWAIYKDRPEDWIDRIDKRWQGTIPATIMFNKARGISFIHETEITYVQLDQKIKVFIQ